MKENLGVYYSQTSTFQAQQFARLVSLMMEHCALHLARYVLDIGCGDGQRTAELLPLFPQAEHITGIDPDPEMIATAKHLNTSEKIFFHRASAENMMLLWDEQHPFDIAVSNWAVHWIEDKHKFLKNLDILIKDNGFLAFSTCERLPEILTDIDDFMRDELRHSKTLINPFHYLKSNQWKSLLQENGWQVVCEYKARILHEEADSFRYLKHWFAASTGKFAYNRQIEEFNPLAIDTLLAFLEKKYPPQDTNKTGLSFAEDVLFIIAKKI